MNKQTIVSAAKNIRKALQKHSPEILTGIGIAGMIATTVVAVRATPKALQLIDEREIKEDQRLNTSEVIKTAWKCYIPAAVTGTLSIVCLIGASSVNMKRNAALATAYTISETALKEYQEKTRQVVGEKKEQAIQDAVAKDIIEKNPVEGKEVVMTGAGETLCLDVLSGRYFKSDVEKLRRAANELSRRMLDEMYVSLNDFYYEIGLSNIELGDMLGWTVEKGMVDLDFSAQVAENGVPCLVIKYRVAPQYDYNRGF